MSKKEKKEKVFLPKPLLREKLASFNKDSHYKWQEPDVLDIIKQATSDTLNSEEMAVALSDYVFGDKNIIWEIDEFFIDKYPNTLKNAIKLEFKYYLGYDHKPKNNGKKHPHMERLLNAMEEKESSEFSDFCKICRTLKNLFDERTKAVKATWERIKDFPFERAVATVSGLCMANPNLNLLEDCSYYLNEYWNESNGFNNVIDTSSWENFDKNVLKEFLDETLDRKEIILHINLIGHLNWVGKTVCNFFMFDKTFMLDESTGNFSFDKKSESLISLKNRLLNEYYRVIARKRIGDELAEVAELTDDKRSQFIALKWAKYIGYPMLREYYGISDKFKYNGKDYDLLSLLVHDNVLTDHWENIYKDSPYKTPINAFTISKQPDDTPYGDKEQYLRIRSTDLSDKSKKIDLYLSDMLHYGNSDICFIFTQIRAAKKISYLAPINFLKSKIYWRDRKEVTEESKQIESTVAELFKNHPMPMFFGTLVKESSKFRNSEMNEEGEIDVSIYDNETKTLILIEVKSTYVSLNLEDSFKHRRCLMFAGHQLDKAIYALEKDAKLREEVTGDPSIAFKDIRIETLIVSTSFEFDGERFYSRYKPEGHRKISLLELMIRTKGTAVLLIMEPIFQSAIKNPEIKFEKDEFEKNLKSAIMELLPYKGDAPIGDFLEALNSNIWEKILPYWQEKL